jgi:thioredoxin reductase (NADPH)
VTGPMPSVIDTRRHQMFPILDPAEITRVLRFGQVRSYKPGEALLIAGDAGQGLIVVLTGKADVTRRDQSGHSILIVSYGPGAFIGELAQLAGRPALVDAHAQGTVEALLIAPDQLRALLVAEAELGERIMRALILRRVGLLESGAGGPVIVGGADTGDVLRLSSFLRRNGHPYLTLDPQNDLEAKALIERFRVDPGQLPIVLCPNGQLLANPTEEELARCIGLVSPIDPSRIYDVAVVGAGPAGLATAVYAASEGLSVLVLDCRAFGGQAGASARIENYLGFPTGISGIALMARAYNQAQKFGAEMAIPSEAFALQHVGSEGEGRFIVNISNDENVTARSIVIASGARYRRLELENLEAFESSSVHYWASPLEGKLSSGREVALVGGGNSAGQAAVYLAGQAAKVLLLVRGGSLESSMARYLVDRIKGLANVEVITGAEITKLEGHDGVLEAICWRDGGRNDECRRPIGHLFLFIGAEPNTKWVCESGVRLDPKGFVLTGAKVAGSRNALETSLPGVFAVGDVRSGSIKRVAAAVGEGAQVVAALHGFLAEATQMASKSPAALL